MFSSERPQYISPPSGDLLAVEKLFDRDHDSAIKGLLAELRNAAVEPLPKTGQPPGHAIGFFEQGILLGAGLFLSVVVPAMGYGWYVLGRFAWKSIMSRRV